MSYDTWKTTEPDPCADSCTCPNRRCESLDATCPGCGADQSECACDTIVVDDPDAPHTCVFVATDDGDRCETCGARPVADEWDRAAYDFEGGAG